MLLKCFLTEEALTGPGLSGYSACFWLIALQEENETAAPWSAVHSTFPPFSRLLLVMFVLDSSLSFTHAQAGNEALLSCTPCSGSELKCPHSHRNLDLRLPLGGDTWRKKLGGRYRWAEKGDRSLNFCTKIQMWQLCFLNEDALWCLKCRSVPQSSVEES